MSDIREEDDCRRLVASRCDLMMRESAMSTSSPAATVMMMQPATLALGQPSTTPGAISRLVVEITSSYVILFPFSLFFGFVPIFHQDLLRRYRNIPFWKELLFCCPILLQSEYYYILLDQHKTCCNKGTTRGKRVDYFGIDHAAALLATCRESNRLIQAE